jgi:hypothetical protein
MKHDLAGRRFGNLVAIRYIPGTKSTRKAKWLCRCDCGQERENGTNDLLTGRIQSCGCTKHEKIGAKKRTHGHSVGAGVSRTFRIWTNMKTRCFNPKGSSYAHYGARGITVCEEWRGSFEQFLADMGEAPARMSLDRIDTNGPYSKANCRWATQQQQMSNTRATRLIPCDGELMPMSEAARRKGIKPATVHARLKQGWSVERALSEPVRTTTAEHGIEAGGRIAA